LSRSSSSSRSAVFLPMPLTAVSRAISLRAMTRASSPPGSAESTESAVRGPTPETEMTARNTSRSWRVANPNSSSASSRTLVWM